jgi:hypothetical protein
MHIGADGFLNISTFLHLQGYSLENKVKKRLPEPANHQLKRGQTVISKSNVLPLTIQQVFNVAFL